MAQTFKNLEVYGYGRYNVAVVGPRSRFKRFQQQGYVVVRLLKSGRQVVVGANTKRFIDGLLGAVARAKAAAST